MAPRQTSRAFLNVQRGGISEAKLSLVLLDFSRCLVQNNLGKKNQYVTKYDKTR